MAQLTSFLAQWHIFFGTTHIFFGTITLYSTMVNNDSQYVREAKRGKRCSLPLTFFVRIRVNVFADRSHFSLVTVLDISVYSECRRIISDVSCDICAKSIKW